MVVLPSLPLGTEKKTSTIVTLAVDVSPPIPKFHLFSGVWTSLVIFLRRGTVPDDGGSRSVRSLRVVKKLVSLICRKVFQDGCRGERGS